MHTLLLLEANPGWLERMREEQRQVVAKYGPALTGTRCRALKNHPWLL